MLNLKMVGEKKIKMKENKIDNIEKAAVECSPPIFTYWDQIFLILSIAGYIFNKIIGKLASNKTGCLTVVCNGCLQVYNFI